MILLQSRESVEHIHYRMSRVAHKDTQLEVSLRKKLHASGLRFRKNVRSLPGTPDIVFPKRRIVVFVDGDFWHGHKLAHLEKRVSSYWSEKIRRNIERDSKNVVALEELGWMVLRFWGHEIEHDLEDVVKRILDAFRSRGVA